MDESVVHVLHDADGNLGETPTKAEIDNLDIGRHQHQTLNKGSRFLQTGGPRLQHDVLAL
jgi:hypothetical protein